MLAGDSAAHNSRSDTKALKVSWELRWMGEGSAVPLVIKALPSCCRTKEQSDEMLVEALMRIQVDPSGEQNQGGSRRALCFQVTGLFAGLVSCDCNYLLKKR